jgi:hypothetical protein
VFLLNSHETHFFATSRTTSPVRGYSSRPPFFRSYGSRLPSSLTRILSRALVYSTRPPVSDYGTDTLCIDYEVFLGSVVKTTSPGLTPDRYHLSRLTSARILPARSLYRLKPTRPVVGWSDFLRCLLAVTHITWFRNINRMPYFDYAFRPRLRTD